MSHRRNGAHAEHLKRVKRCKRQPCSQPRLALQARTHARGHLWPQQELHFLRVELAQDAGGFVPRPQLQQGRHEGCLLIHGRELLEGSRRDLRAMVGESSG